jgi:hypothetical protein
MEKDFPSTSWSDRKGRPEESVSPGQTNSASRKHNETPAIYKKLVCALALMVGLKLYHSYRNLGVEVDSVFSTDFSTDRAEDAYAAGYADKGWKFGLENSDHTWLGDLGTEQESSTERDRSGHRGHHGGGKHHHHPHNIGPKEAEALFLKVPNNDSVAA